MAFKKTNSTKKRPRIAIVGIACRFPGADNYIKFWNNLEQGVNSIQIISNDRWDVEHYYSKDINQKNKSVSKWCGTVDDVDKFDNKFFCISTREANNMDPQQRLLLEETWHCIEDSGIPLKTLQNKKTSVYVGVMTADYMHEAVAPHAETDSYSCLGNYESILANRISYSLDLKGVSLSINAACASSLVSIHEAKNSLINGESDYAFACGVSLNLHPFKYISFSKSRMLSPDGQCKTFDKDANGYVPGEGVGVLLLQRLDEAIGDGNHIYGIIKGTNVNHGGKSLSITAPRVEAQKQVIVGAYKDAGISPETVGYMEAHGTGTSLGDPIEIEAATQAFREFTDKNQICMIGSVKTNIGHLEAAAGLAGVIKVLMMMKHKKIPPSLNIKSLNPIIDFHRTPFSVAANLMDWDSNSKGAALRAGVSSFGFGGVNSHILLEEYNQTSVRVADDEDVFLPFTLSAKSISSMEKLITSWRKFIENGMISKFSLNDICMTLLNGRENYEFRAGTMIKSKKDIENFLKNNIGISNEENDNKWCMRLGEIHLKGFKNIEPLLGQNSVFDNVLHSLLKQLEGDETGRKLVDGFYSDKWPKSSQKLYHFITGYSYAASMHELGLSTELIICEKLGFWVGLAISGIAKTEDVISVLSGNTEVSLLKLSRPKIPLYDSVNSHIIGLFCFSEEYMRFMFEEINIQHDPIRKGVSEANVHTENKDEVLAHYIEKAKVLNTCQFTFKKFLEEWNCILKKSGYDISIMLENPDLLTSETDKCKKEKLLLMVIIISSFIKLNQKWELTEQKLIEEQRFFELVDLVNDEVMPKEVFVELLTSENPDYSKALKILNNRQNKMNLLNEYKYIKEFNQNLEEITNTAEWIQKALEADELPVFNNMKYSEIGSFSKSKSDVVSISACTDKHKIQHINELLIKLWLEGVNICWGKAYSAVPYKKAQLPTYVFEKHSFWLPRLENKKDESNDKDRQAGPVSQSDDNLLNFVRILDPASDYIIRDTVVEGDCITPSPLRIEMAFQASRRSDGNNINCLYDIRFPNPGIFLKTTKIEVKVQNDFQKFEVIKDDNETLMVGKFRNGESRAANQANINSLCKGIRVDSDHVYSLFYQWGYHYGPSMKLIEEIWENEEEFVVKIVPKSTSEGAATKLDPFILDCMFQGVFYSGYRMGDLFENIYLYVPFTIKAISLIGDMSKSCYAVIRKKSLRILENKNIVLSFDAYNENGAKILEVEDIHFHRVHRSFLKDYIMKNNLQRVDRFNKQNSDFDSLTVNVEQHAETLREEIIRLENGISVMEDYGRLKLFDIAFGAIRSEYRENSFSNTELLEELRVIPKYTRLMDAFVNMWCRSGMITKHSNGFAIVKEFKQKEIIRQKVEKLQLKLEQIYSDLRPFKKLLDTSLDNFKRIVSGEVSHMEVFFAGGSMALFENIYKENNLSDYYNKLVMLAVKYIVERNYEGKRTEKLRILEIGAGTGGTSAVVLEGIKEYGQMLEYTYNDISKGFINYGREKYGSKYPFLKFEVVSIDNYVVDEKSRYDIILATNVVHATKNLTNTLSKCRELLNPGGVLILNEITQVQDYWTMITGLIDGWWLFEDFEARLEHSPLASFRMWKDILSRVGFESIKGIDVNRKKEYEQTIIITRNSNKEIKQNNEVLKNTGVTLNMKSTDYSYQSNVHIIEENKICEETLTDRTNDYLKEIFAKRLHIKKEDIKNRGAFRQEYGVDSLVTLEIIEYMESIFGILSKTLLYEYTTIEKLTGYFVENFKDILAEKFKDNLGDSNGGNCLSKTENTDCMGNTDITQKKYVNSSIELTGVDETGVTAGSNDIAIIGLSGRFPMAPDVEELWKNLLNGKSSTREVPSERWDYRKYYSQDRENTDKSYTKWGGFLEEFDGFDPLFFNISPRQAELMDPQQRVFMESVWSAIEDAGYTRQNISNNTGVFVGVTTNTYGLYAAEESMKGNVQCPDVDNYDVANRVSYFFDFHGPSMSIDTACSSSLTAVHLAVQSLKRNECDTAVVGGVNLTLHPNRFIYFCQKNMLIGEKDCHPFGMGKGGFVDSEGVVSILLKPLSKAVDDKDNIYGVIKGTAINSGGKTSGYTVPNPRAQKELIQKALKDGNVDARTISYIEAHGTGTTLGDPIEIEGLKQAFRDYTPDKQYCAIGSIKSNIGHLIAAAGLAGLTKVLLQMRYKKLVPSINSQVLNPYINFEESPFYVQQKIDEWKKICINTDKGLKEFPRRAGISSFGAGGANAHIIVEEFEQTEIIRENRENQNNIVVLSSKKEENLKLYAQKLLNYLEDCDDCRRNYDVSFENIAYTLQVGREAMKERIAVVASNKLELIDKLRQFCKGNEKIDGVYRGNIDDSESAPINIQNAKAGEEIIKNLISIKDFNRIAQMWVDGMEVNWNLLYSSQAQKRISLPTYPFIRERFWIPQTDKSIAVSEMKYDVLHPLVGKNTSTLVEQKFTSTLTGNEFFLSDHYVGIQKVLPGVAYLEMSRAAGEFAKERKVRYLKNIVWPSPIALKDSYKTINIVLNPFKDWVEYEVNSFEDTDSKVVHGQGRLIFKEDENSNSNGTYLNIDEIRDRCGHTMTGNEYYPRFYHLGLRLGDSFKVIQEIRYNRTEALSSLRLPDHLKHEAKQFNLHPSMIDASLQTALGLLDLRKNSDVLYIPFTIGEVEIIDEIPEECYAYVMIDDRQAIESDINKFKVQILDTSGKVLLKITDFIVRPFQPFTTGSDDNSLKAASAEMYFTTGWEVCGLKRKTDNMSHNEKILIFDIDRHMYNHICDCSERNNRPKVILVTPKAGYRKLEDNEYEINPASQSDYEQLFSDLENESLLPDKIIHLWSRDEFVSETYALKSQLEKGLYSIFYLSKVLMKFKIPDTKKIIYAFNSFEKFIQPHYEAIGGFFNTVNLENPKLLFKTIEFTGQATDYLQEKIPQMLLDELFSEENWKADILYEGDQRFVRCVKEISMPDNTNDSEYMKENGVYLITGGAGGLGLTFAKHLAEKGKVILVLTGRSNLNATQKAVLGKIEELGSEVTYIKSDVSKPDEVDRLISQVKEKFGRINGVLHSAGLIRDSYITNKVFEDVEDVLSPKLYGTINLDNALRDEQLDFFVVFSSITAITGNLGQSDYSYANSFMDRFVDYRENLRKQNKRFGSTLSINWNFWRDGGMKIDRETEEMLELTMGLKFSNRENGLDTFSKALASDVCQFINAQGERNRILKLLNIDGDLSKNMDNLKNGESPLAQMNYHSDENKRNNIGENTQASEFDTSAQLQLRIQAGMIKDVSSILKIKEKDIDVNKEMRLYGFDSISFTKLSNYLNKTYNLDITPAVFFEYSTIKSFLKYLVEAYSDKFKAFYNLDQDIKHVQKVLSTVNEEDANKNTKQNSRFSIVEALDKVDCHCENTLSKSKFKEPIAIIGMSGVLPLSENLEVFWKNLEMGKNMISEVPKDRWDWREYYGDPQKEAGKTNIKWGGFIDDADKFDAGFFNISPREAELMDPQQRIFLGTVWKTIEDAGYKVSDLSKVKTGLFVGVSTFDYFEVLKNNKIDTEAYTTTGVFHSILANRISYLLNLNGPSVPIDTACSSSLVAMRQAVESIWSGSCEVAIVGGVNLMLTPTVFISFSKAGMLSKDGKCKTFDKDANGYVRAEGSGAVLLKPLSKAVADKDNIYAVIKGISVNHGGRVNSLTVPNPNAQADLIVKAFEEGGIGPETVSYIEAHGTGTSLGDPIEINGLKKAFKEMYKNSGKTPIKEAYCGIGSVKTNIGHLEAGAGISGVLKVVLAMKNKKIPRSINLSEVNPYIQLQDSPFYIVKETKQWKKLKDEKGYEIPRRAGISSFGFGGVNTHVVLEEYEETVKSNTSGNQGSVIIILSAKTEEALREYAKDICSFIERNRTGAVNIDINDEELIDRVKEHLLDIASEVLCIDKGSIDPDEDICDFGLEPIKLMAVFDRINRKYNLELHTTLLSEHTTIERLSKYLTEEYSKELLNQYKNEEGKAENFGDRTNIMSLEDMAYTLQVGREEMEQRLALVVSSLEELRGRLYEYYVNDNLDNIHIGNVKPNKMKDILSGKSGKEFVENSIYNKEYDNLAELWVYGIEIDWKLLYNGMLPARVSLPTYPFRKTRYWAADRSKQENRAGNDKKMYPMLEEINESLSLSQGLVFQKKFNVTDSIVKDHCVLGQAVFPGVGYLEMALESIFKIKKDTNLVLSNITWLKSCSIQNGSKSLYIHLTQKGTGMNYEISSREDKNNTTLFKGDVYFSDAGSSNNRHKVSIESIQDRLKSGLDQAEIYNGFINMGLEYGSYFKGLKFVWGNQNEALGILGLGEETEEELTSYILHPTIIDAALQIVEVLATDYGNKRCYPYLPFAADKIEIHNPVSKNSYGYVKKIGNDMYNLAILDKDGLVCVRIHNFIVREMKDQLKDFFYTPFWKQISLQDKARENSNSIKYTRKNMVLIICPPQRSILEELLRAQYSESVLTIRLGSETKWISEHSFEIAIGDVNGFELFLKSVSQLDTVYFLGGLEDADIQPDNIDKNDSAQETGVLSFFRFIKSLINNGFCEKPIDFKIITANTQSVIEGEKINPSAASLFGITKTIVREYPKWKACCIDLNMEDITHLAKSEDFKFLADQIISESLEKGECISIRNGKRFVQVIKRAEVIPSGEMPFKNQGVYMILGGAGGIGLEVSVYLSQRFQAKIALIGRSELNDAQKEKIDLIKSKGGEVLYVKADASDTFSIKRAVDTVKSRFGNLNGVIHSAIVLKDKSLENMDEETFKVALMPKVRGSVVLYDALKGEKLDFMMFFSSIQSFLGNPGQGNYASACTFEDAFARFIGQQVEYPVKVINWGFWGRVGVVASDEYIKRMALQGIWPIETTEGMHAIARILSSNAMQVVPVKADSEFMKSIGLDLNYNIEFCQPQKSVITKDGMNFSQKPLFSYQDQIECSKSYKELEKFGDYLLLNTFQRMGVFNRGGEKIQKDELKKRMGILDSYSRLFDVLLKKLETAGFIKIENHNVVTTSEIDTTIIRDLAMEIGRMKETLTNSFNDIRSHVSLLWNCFENYPDILRGKSSATHVLFPNSSMELVEGIYKGNMVADYFNSLVVWSLEYYIKEKLQYIKHDEKIRILEIGAGTGGTSEQVFNMLKKYSDRLKYLYTDISAGFTQYGRKMYGENNPYVEFKVLNIEDDVESQGYDIGSFDVIIAANIIHATRNIRKTINNVKALLKTNGWMVLNELTGIPGFITQTFGLLEGWWIYEDENERLSGSPLLNEKMWERVLMEEGFKHVLPLAQYDGDFSLNQHVIIAESNGVVKSKDKEHITGKVIEKSVPFGNSNSSSKAAKHKDVTLREKVSVIVESNTDATRRTEIKKDSLQAAKNVIIDGIVKTLGVNINEVDISKQFSEFGVDSITGLELVRYINENLGITLKTTIIFDYGNVSALADYISKKFGSGMSKVVSLEGRSKTVVGMDNAAAAKGDIDLLEKLAMGQVSDEEVYQILGGK